MGAIETSAKPPPRGLDSIEPDDDREVTRRATREPFGRAPPGESPSTLTHVKRAQGMENNLSDRKLLDAHSAASAVQFSKDDLKEGVAPDSYWRIINRGERSQRPGRKNRGS